MDTPKPYSMKEINSMMDLAEQQFEAGEYSENEEMFDRLYRKYGLRDEVTACA